MEITIVMQVGGQLHVIWTPYTNCYQLRACHSAPKSTKDRSTGKGEGPHRRSYHRGPWARAQTFFSLFLELIMTVTWQWQSNEMQTLPSRWSTRIFINWRHSSTLLLSNLCREITKYICWLAITVLLYMFHCNQWPHRRQEQAEDFFHIFHS